MKWLLAISLSVIDIGPALAAQYIVVRDTQRNVCEVVTEKPSYREWVQIGEEQFLSLEEAQRHQRLVCATFSMLRSNSVP